MIAMEGDVLVYRERLPLWQRAVAIVLGITVAVGIPAVFLVLADWTQLTQTLLLAVPFIVFPIALGGFFVFMGLVSATRLRMDPNSGLAERQLFGPVINRTDRFPLSEVKPPDIFLRRSREEDSMPVLRLSLPRGCIEMMCFCDLADAQAWEAQINRILAAHPALGAAPQ